MKTFLKKGRVISKNNNLLKIIVSYHYWHLKYKKLQKKIKKYLIYDNDNIFNKNDIVLLDIQKNKILKYIN